LINDPVEICSEAYFGQKVTFRWEELSGAGSETLILQPLVHHIYGTSCIEQSK
jgi:hypothetical protein